MVFGIALAASAFTTGLGTGMALKPPNFTFGGLAGGTAVSVEEAQEEVQVVPGRYHGGFSLPPSPCCTMVFDFKGFRHSNVAL